MSEVSPKNTRFPTSELAFVEAYGKKGSFKVLMKNISQTGAYFEWLDTPAFKQGDLLRVTVYLSQINKNRQFSAELVWQKDAGCGVCFVKPEEVVERMLTKGVAV